MKSLRIGLSTTFLLAVSLIAVDVMPASAVTCESTCNQLRRACRRVAKANLSVQYANCDEGRDTCRADCEANATQCPIDCQTTHAACVGGGGVGCDEALALCLDDCANCPTNCNAERVACRDTAKSAREAANLACDGARESCDSVCVDPIDPACVAICRTGRHDCDADAKRDEKTCRQACGNGTEQRACARDCRRDKNSAFMLCADQEVVCLGGCAGVLP